MALSHPGAHCFKYMPRSRITESHSGSSFSFWRISILLSIAVELVCICTDSVEVFLFPHILASICCCLCCRWQPFWLRWNLNVVLICISYMEKMLSFPLNALCEYHGVCVIWFSIMSSSFLQVVIVAEIPSS
jgi:hypothetical protein